MTSNLDEIENRISQYGTYSVEMTPIAFPSPLESLRKSGRESFLASGFPTLKTERWRATDIKAVTETQFSPVELVDVTVHEPIAGVEIRDRIRVINGQVQSNLDHFSGDHKTIVAKSVSQHGNSFPAELIGSIENGTGSPFYSLNTALFTDALSLSVEGVSDQNIQIQYHAVSANKPSAVSNRTVIEVRAGAKLNLIQQFISEGDDAVLSNAVTEIILHPNATLNHTILADESKSVNHFHQIFVHQMEHSNYESVTLAPNGDLTRVEFQVFLKGEQANAEVRGVFAGSGSRKFNGDITMVHDAKNCSSRMNFKAIGGDKSHGIFRGLVHVTENGAGTDARQSFKSLIVSDEARVTTEPHLLIHNDDVSCSHGATVGQLDDKQLFYLESRGLNPEEAKKILILSFAADVVSTLASGLSEYLLERIHDEVVSITETKRLID